MFTDTILTNHIILNDRPTCEIALVCVQSAYRVGAGDKLEQFGEIHTFRAKFSRKALLNMAAVVKGALDNFPKECQCGRVAVTRNPYGEDACDICAQEARQKEEPPGCEVCGKVAIWGLTKCMACFDKPKECSADPANCPENEGRGCACGTGLTVAEDASEAMARAKDERKSKKKGGGK